jgi:hypothetical protein
MMMVVGIVGGAIEIDCVERDEIAMVKEVEGGADNDDAQMTEGKRLSPRCQA